MANIVVAYILWVFGGPFGLHLFYLGRDRHAFVWWMSLGGLLVGWFRDLWRLPEYVYEANQDKRFLYEFAGRRNRHKKPPFSLVRFCGQIFIGMLLGFLCRLVIPEKILLVMPDPLKQTLAVALPVLGTAIGVYLTANIGHQKVGFDWCLVGSLVAIPWLLPKSPSLVYGPVFASLAAAWNTDWDPDHKPPKGACKFVQRTFVLTVAGCVYLAMWTSVVMYNVYVPSNDGLNIPISEALENFFNSPAWKELKKTFASLYDYCQSNGWEHCYKRFIEHIDPTGESHAYKVLEFETSKPTPEEIKSQCRKMSRKWHPDKYRTEVEKDVAQEKFIEIQKACEVLDSMRDRRSKKNMKDNGGGQSGKKGSHKHTEF